MVGFIKRYWDIQERNNMEQTKRVKSKIVYPHLGIIDEIEEEVFVREDEEANKDISDVNHSDISRREAENRT